MINIKKNNNFMLKLRHNINMLISNITFFYLRIILGKKKLRVTFPLT